jgi:hypothetical protein
MSFGSMWLINVNSSYRVGGTVDILKDIIQIGGTDGLINLAEPKTGT